MRWGERGIRVGEKREHTEGEKKGEKKRKREREREKGWRPLNKVWGKCGMSEHSSSYVGRRNKV